MREIRTVSRNGDEVTLTLSIIADPKIVFGNMVVTREFPELTFEASETVTHQGRESLMSYSKYATVMCRLYMRVSTEIGKKINEVEREFGRCPLCGKTYDRGDMVCSMCGEDRR